MDTSCILPWLIKQAVRNILGIKVNGKKKRNILGLHCFHSFIHTFFHSFIHQYSRSTSIDQCCAQPQGYANEKTQCLSSKSPQSRDAKTRTETNPFNVYDKVVRKCRERHSSQPGDGCHGGLLGYETPQTSPRRWVNVNQFWGRKAF